MSKWLWVPYTRWVKKTVGCGYRRDVTPKVSERVSPCNRFSGKTTHLSESRDFVSTLFVTSFFPSRFSRDRFWVLIMLSGGFWSVTSRNRSSISVLTPLAQLSVWRLSGWHEFHLQGWTCPRDLPNPPWCYKGDFITQLNFCDSSSLFLRWWER